MISVRPPTNQLEASGDSLSITVPVGSSGRVWDRPILTRERFGRFLESVQDEAAVRCAGPGSSRPWR
jgi:hypothetical protein